MEFLGEQLLKYIPNSVGSTTKLHDIESELKFMKPKNVISAAGISGKPTVDWCETHKDETIHTNLTQQLHLIQVCKNMGIHLTILVLRSCMMVKNTLRKKTHQIMIDCFIQKFASCWKI